MILVVGANGQLGSSIVKNLKKRSIDFYECNRTDSLENMPWLDISIIINCVACVPRKGNTKEDYFSSNVIFVQDLLEFSKGKDMIHFSTLSELYKSGDYQYSKMIGNTILLLNSKYLNSLKIFHLPTLEDRCLIDSIIKKAEAGLKPVVNEVIYNYMDFDDVSEFVLSNMFSYECDISTQFVVKNLYDEVLRYVAESEITKGKKVNRQCMVNGRYTVSPELIKSEWGI